MWAGSTASTRRAAGKHAEIPRARAAWILHSTAHNTTLAGEKLKLGGARPVPGSCSAKGPAAEPCATAPELEAHLDAQRGAAEQEARPGALVTQAGQRRHQASQRVSSQEEGRGGAWEARRHIRPCVAPQRQQLIHLGGLQGL